MAEETSRTTEEQHPDALSSSQEKKEEERVPQAPGLRTFHADTQRVVEGKGNAELRTSIAREMQEKKEEQRAYKKKVRELQKEALILKDKQNKLTEEESSLEKLKREATTPAQPVDTPTVEEKKQAPSVDPQLIKGVAGAAKYLEIVAKKARERKARTAQPSPSETPPSSETPITRITPATYTDKDISRLAEQVVENEELPEERPPSFPEKKGVFSSLRSSILTPKKSFSKEEKKAMQAEQEVIVKKKEMEDAWQQFHQKKENLREQGYTVRDMRSYNPFPEKNKTLQRQNFIVVGSIMVVLVGFIFLVFSIVTRETETPGVISEEVLRPARDVITNERNVAVDLEVDRERWSAVSAEGGTPFTVTKFIPFERRETERVQITLGQLFSLFTVGVPAGLFDTLGSYYFIGNYREETSVNGIVILSVKNYGDALVWMLNWEKYAINGMANLFPTQLEASNPENTTVQKRIIDNQDVRILKNQKRDTTLSYYFFNRSVLVFIIGDEQIIPQINKRIIAANVR